MWRGGADGQRMRPAEHAFAELPLRGACSSMTTPITNQRLSDQLAVLRQVEDRVEQLVHSIEDMRRRYSDWLRHIADSIDDHPDTVAIQRQILDVAADLEKPLIHVRPRGVLVSVPDE